MAERHRQHRHRLRFRRQEVLGPYIADFYCHQAKVVIEIDGIAHDMGDQPVRDEVRNRWMHEHGLKVIRIPAADVLADPPAIAQSLAVMCLPSPYGNA